MNADRVAQLVADVRELTRPAGLLDQLEDLLGEPTADPSVGGSGHRKVSGSPAPWHPEVAAVWLEIHAGARDLEARLLLAVAGVYGVADGAGRRADRGGSAGNTRRALDALPRLVGAVSDSLASETVVSVARWVRAAKQVRDIDESERWVPVPRLPGRLPPACPYCETFSLRMCRERGEVRCINHACVDGGGFRPRARMEHGVLSGEEALVFRDGARIVFLVDDEGEAAS